MKVNKLLAMNLKSYKKQSVSDGKIAEIIKKKLDLSIKSDTYIGKNSKIK